MIDLTCEMCGAPEQEWRDTPAGWDTTVILWCETHLSQVIQTWEHPLLKGCSPAAWCDVGDWLGESPERESGCSITSALVTVATRSPA